MGVSYFYTFYLIEFMPFELHSYPMRKITDKEDWGSERVKDLFKIIQLNKPQRHGLKQALSNAKDWGFFATNQQLWLGSLSVARLIPQNR